MTYTNAELAKKVERLEDHSRLDTTHIGNLVLDRDELREAVAALAARVEQLEAWTHEAIFTRTAMDDDWSNEPYPADEVEETVQAIRSIPEGDP